MNIIEKIKKASKLERKVLVKKIFTKIKNLLKDIFRVEIKFLKKSEKGENDRYSYQKSQIDFDIKRGDKVLDIGSGHYPFPLATHLADFYEDKTIHRAGLLVKDKRPFFGCSVEKMPFKDKEFDFVYCSHVLEHVENPSKACDELMRVAKRGYIETPTKINDIMFGYTGIKNHHKWHINFVGNTLIFIEWTEKEMRPTTSYFFEQYHSKFKNPFQDFVKLNQDFFANMFLWNGGFNYYVFDNKGELISKKD